MAHLFTPLRIVVAAGAGTATVFAAGQRTIWADEAKASNQKKLPIYAPPEPEVVLVSTESELVDTIGRTRRILVRAGEESKDGIQGVIGRWIQVERRVESRVKSLISPEEPVTPGILYVGVAALSGSVFARGRSLPTRLILPPALFVGALNYFLPKTTQNVNNYLTSIERAHFPAVAEQHEAANKAFRDAIQSMRVQYASLRGGASQIVENSVDGLESTTGLKIRDATIGRAQDASAAAQHKAGSISQNIQERAAEFHDRAAGVVHDVQSRFSKSETDGPGGLLAKSKNEKDIKEKVEEVVRDVRAEAAAALGVAKGAR
ncbi:Apolipoprotein O [Ceratobasidium sp. AG-Ba]|nr:Apolipoprotein O [Ceratobasidium sp. AG-Ba]